MRILLVNKFLYQRGGDCIHTMQLNDLLQKNGHEVAIFTMQHPQNIKHKDFIYWPSEVRFSLKSPFHLLKALKRPLGEKEVKIKFKNLIRTFNPQVVHVHNIHSQLSPTIIEIAKRNNIPVVWTMHDYKLICPAYTFLDNDGNICEECLKDVHAVYRKRCIKGSRLASYMGLLEAKKWNKERISLSVNCFIAPSLFLKTKLIQGGFNGEKIKQLYNFVEDEKFSTSINLNRRKQVVFVGRLSKEKGVETLCKAFESLKTVKINIIGDGPLKAKLEREYTSDNISFLGYQNWDFIKEEINKSLFLVVPSEWYENNPLTILEAHALGTPVLGAKIGGISELINEENGMLFNAKDQLDLKSKLSLMINKEDWDYSKIREQAKQKFSQDLFYKNIKEVYTQFL